LFALLVCEHKASNARCDAGFPSRPGCCGKTRVWLARRRDHTEWTARVSRARQAGAAVAAGAQRRTPPEEASPTGGLLITGRGHSEIGRAPSAEGPGLAIAAPALPLTKEGGGHGRPPPSFPSLRPVALRAPGQREGEPESPPQEMRNLGPSEVGGPSYHEAGASGQRTGGRALAFRLHLLAEQPAAAAAPRTPHSQGGWTLNVQCSR
jgi:hypothetical protein